MKLAGHATSQDELRRAWSEALVALRARIVHDNAAGIWLPNLVPLDARGERVTIAAPNAYQARYLDAHIGALLAECLSDALGRPVTVSFAVMPQGDAGRRIVPEAVQPVRVAPPRRQEDFGSCHLNSRYTFDNFVVGPCNRVAHAAARSVVKNPGGACNPLFVYSGVGLGKTHLMQAIGHALRELDPNMEVVYISGEVFLQHVVAAIREDKMDLFRRRYRRVAVWLVDDIQFIASRENSRTEAEFFFTFNALYESGKQIVISSDRPPKQLQLMDDRLRSRFEMGLMTDMAAPDQETRVAILQQRASAMGASLSQEAIDYIADVVRSNIRSLEGALRRIVYTASIDDVPITMDLVRECLADYSRGSSDQGVTIAAVRAAVAARFGVAESELVSPSRARSTVLPRQIAMYLCRQLTDRPLQAIGAEFGGRDHSTVLHSCAKAEQAAEADPSVAAVIAELTQALQRSASR